MRDRARRERRQRAVLAAVAVGLAMAPRLARAAGAELPLSDRALRSALVVLARVAEVDAHDGVEGARLVVLEVLRGEPVEPLRVQWTTGLGESPRVAPGLLVVAWLGPGGPTGAAWRPVDDGAGLEPVGSPAEEAVETARAWCRALAALDPGVRRERLLEAALGALEGGGPLAASRAALELERGPEPSGPALARARSALAARLSGHRCPCPEARALARLAGHLGSPAAARALLEAPVLEADPALAADLARSLARGGAAGAAMRLEVTARARGAAGRAARRSALELAGRAGLAEAGGAVGEALSSEDPGLRLAAVEAAARLRLEAHLGALVRLLEAADDPEEAGPLVAALARQDRALATLALRRAAASHPTAAVRDLAADALRRPWAHTFPYRDGP